VSRAKARPGAAGKPIVKHCFGVAHQTLHNRKATAVTDTDEMTSADQDRLRMLEEMMKAGGFVRSSHGFWIAPGVETKTETRLAVQFAEEL
jgi:hypothetical protein